MKNLILSILLLTMALPAFAAERRLPEGTIAHRDLSYITDGHERQKLDLYIPAGDEPFPLLVWVHGGAWRAGSKENPPALPWLQKNVAVSSINYRLSQHAIFPAQIEDCKAAIRWLRANARKYNLDDERLVVWGSSAGGHLVAMLGTTGDVRRFDIGEHTDRSSAVTAAVDYFGPTDFLQMDTMDGDIGTMDHDVVDSPESKLVGGPIQKNPDKVKNANPITYVSPGDPPFLIVHGNRDPLVAHGQSVILFNALKTAGIDAELYTVKGGKHGGFRDPVLEKKLQAFIAEHLKSNE